jgi:hypothetical protein
LQGWGCGAQFGLFLLFLQLGELGMEGRQQILELAVEDDALSSFAYLLCCLPGIDLQFLTFPKLLPKGLQLF